MSIYLFRYSKFSLSPSLSISNLVTITCIDLQNLNTVALTLTKKLATEDRENVIIRSRLNSERAQMLRLRAEVERTKLQSLQELLEARMKGQAELEKQLYERQLVADDERKRLEQLRCLLVEREVQMREHFEMNRDTLVRAQMAEAKQQQLEKERSTRSFQSSLIQRFLKGKGMFDNNGAAPSVTGKKSEIIGHKHEFVVVDPSEDLDDEEDTAEKATGGSDALMHSKQSPQSGQNTSTVNDPPSAAPSALCLTVSSACNSASATSLASEVDLRLLLQHDTAPLGRDIVTVEQLHCRGYLIKLGRMHKTWLKRWFVLSLPAKKLFYYTNSDEKSRKGSINLVEIFNVVQQFTPDEALPTFHIMTPYRTFHVRSLSSQAAEAWMDILSGVVGLA